MFWQAILATFCVAQSKDTAFSYLKDARKDWSFVPYTPEQKVQVAQTVVNAFSIYVNRDSKIENYGKEKPDIDAIPRVEKVLKNAANMSDKDFHYGFTSIVLSQRDGHLNYQMPAPHSCNVAIQAVRFTVINESNGKDQEKIVAAGFTGIPQVIQLSPQAARISVGDELLKVDGVPIQQFIKSKLFEYGGANEFGGLRGVLYRLSATSGSLHQVPENDSRTYELRSRTDGKVYTVTLPWINRSQVSCLQTAQTLIEQIKTDSVPESFVEDEPAKKQKYDMFVNPNVQLDQELFGTVDTHVALDVKPTEDDIIKYSIYKPESENLGIIYLTSFVPKEQDPIKGLEIIRKLLVNELKDTNAVLFDIRDNGGGIITLADTIPQLFAPNFQPGGARALVAPINQKIFLNSTKYERDAWSEAYEKVKTGDKYAPITIFTEPAVANALGQAYIRPVGLLTNGNCYSACDLFSAAMQDNGIATIFGEDGRTGAGGANVNEIEAYFAEKDPESFPPYPYQSILKDNSQNGRISWRQSVRVGKNNGQLIEDNGIKSDIVVRPTVDDILPNSNTFTQYQRIARELNRQGTVSGKKFMYFRTVQDLDSETALGLGIEFDIEIQGLKRVAAFDESGKEVGSLDINAKEIMTKQVVKFKFDYPIDRAKRVKINLKAFDVTGKQQFTTNRNVRILPNPNDYLKLVPKNIYAVNFATDKYVVSFDSVKTASGDGWNLKDGKYVFGDGKQYKNNADSRISAYVNTQTPFKFTVDAIYESELDYDFLKVGYIKDGKVTELLTSKNAEKGNIQNGISGKGALKQTFDVPVTGQVEVFVEFVADGGVTSVGATLNALTISA